MKFYQCKNCNSVLIKIKKSDNIMCCDNEFKELPINSLEASHEKHLPVVSFSNNLMNVSIGSDIHPMSKEHLIEWVFVEYSNGGEYVFLNDDPVVTINVLGRVTKRVYAYCNLHGLFVKEIEE